MYPIETAVAELFKLNYRQVVEITVYGKDSTFTLTETDLVQKSLTIDRYCASGNKIEIGSAIAAELTLTLSNLDGRFDNTVFEGAELFVRIGIKKWDADKWEKAQMHYIPMGYFTVDTPPRKLSQISLSALDRMMRFDRDVDWEALTFPITVENLLQHCCDKCNVAIHTEIANLPNAKYSIPSAPSSTDITYRQLIQWIGEMTGTCAYIDWNGYLRMEWYKDTTTTITAAERYDSDMYENDITITGVQITDIDKNTYLFGSEGYMFNIEGNELIQSDYQIIADNIGANVVGLSYRVYTCTTKPMPHVYPLDKITYVDKKGVSHNTIVTGTVFTINLGTEIVAKGETSTTNSYAATSPLTARERAILEKMKVDTSRELTSRQQAVLELNQVISNSLGLYRTEVEQDNGSITYYYHNAKTLEDSSVIYTFREGGFAWTDNWNNGSPVWQYGITAEGNAVLKYLSVYKLTADHINVADIVGAINESTGETELKISADHITFQGDTLTVLLNEVVTEDGLTNTLEAYVTADQLTLKLSEYTTAENLANTLKLYVTAAELGVELESYVTNGSLSSTLESYVTAEALSTTLSSYATTGEVENKLSLYVTSEGLTTQLSNYVTNGSLSSTLKSYVTAEALTLALSNYTTTDTLESKLSAYMTSQEIGVELQKYVTTQTFDSTLDDYVTTNALENELSVYVTSSSLTTTLSSYVTNNTLTSRLSSYVTSSSLTTKLESYATTAGGSNSSFAYSLTSSNFRLIANNQTVFEATKDGVAITGEITATSGTIGGFEIGTNTLTNATGNSSISIQSNGYTTSFSSLGVRHWSGNVDNGTGWRLDDDGFKMASGSGSSYSSIQITTTYRKVRTPGVYTSGTTVYEGCITTKPSTYDVDMGYSNDGGSFIIGVPRAVSDPPYTAQNEWGAYLRIADYLNMQMCYDSSLGGKWVLRDVASGGNGTHEIAAPYMENISLDVYSATGTGALSNTGYQAYGYLYRLGKMGIACIYYTHPIEEDHWYRLQTSDIWSTCYGAVACGRASSRNSLSGTTNVGGLTIYRVGSTIYIGCDRDSSQSGFNLIAIGEF